MYVLLPEECGSPEGMCEEPNFCLYGFRQAAAAWEKHFSDLLEGRGVRMGGSCGVVSYPLQGDLPSAVRRDDFACCGVEEDLPLIRNLMMKSRFQKNKARALLGPDEGDNRDAALLGSLLKRFGGGEEYGADPKHRRMVLEYYSSMDEGTRGLSRNGGKGGRRGVAGGGIG